MLAAGGDSITNDAADWFIDAIQIERHRGRGFLPLIGAGLSAPSGVPLTWQVGAYVRRCIALALEATDEGGSHARRPWNPRTDQWPPFVDGKHSEPIDWQARIRVVVEQRESESRSAPLSGERRRAADIQASTRRDGRLAKLAAISFTTDPYRKHHDRRWTGAARQPGRARCATPRNHRCVLPRGAERQGTRPRPPHDRHAGRRVARRFAVDDELRGLDRAGLRSIAQYAGGL